MAPSPGFEPGACSLTGSPVHLARSDGIHSKTYGCGSRSRTLLGGFRVRCLAVWLIRNNLMEGMRGTAPRSEGSKPSVLLLNDIPIWCAATVLPRDPQGKNLVLHYQSLQRVYFGVAGGIQTPIGRLCRPPPSPSATATYLFTSETRPSPALHHRTWNPHEHHI